MNICNLVSIFSYFLKSPVKIWSASCNNGFDSMAQILQSLKRPQQPWLNTIKWPQQRNWNLTMCACKKCGLGTSWMYGVTKRCRLSWLAKSSLAYEPKCGGLWGLRHWVQLCTWSPNKPWRSNFTFNLWMYVIFIQHSTRVTPPSLGVTELQ